MSIEVGLKLSLDGQGQVVSGLNAAGRALSGAAQDVGDLEKAALSAAAAQGKLDAATTSAARAQAAYAKALGDSSSAGDQFTDVQQKAALTAQQLAALTAQLAAAGQQGALTGNQTAQLSAQFQDLFVQIQGGGDIITALIQQASQLSASFGGFAPLMAAIRSQITASRVAMLGAGSAALALGLAYKEGATESDVLTRSLILSGNAAGQTAGQLNELAAAQDKIAGTRGLAAASIAELVGSGQVVAEVLGKATEAAIALERTGAGSIADFNKKMISLGEAPLQTLVKLNDAEKFLTRSVYEQVKALEERNKLTEAAVLAQTTYTNMTLSRGKELEQQLGGIERGWRAVKGVAAEAWDAMVGIGRKAPLEDQLQAAERALANAPEPRRGADPAQAEARRAALRQHVEDLRQQIYWEREGATAQRASAEAMRDWQSAQPEAEAARKKAIEDQKRLIESGQQLAVSLQSQAAGLSGGFTDDWKALGAAYKAGAISLTQLERAQAHLLAQQPAMVAHAKAMLDGAQAVADARNKEGAAIGAYLEVQRVADVQTLAGVVGRVRSLQDEMQATDLARMSNISLAQAIEMVGLARARERRDALQPGSEAWSAVQREIDARQQLISHIQSSEARQANAAAAKAMADQWERVNADIGQGLTDALIEGGDNAADYLKRLFKQMVLRPIVQAVVQPVSGALTNALVGAVGNSAGNNNGGVGSLLSSASTANSLYQAYQGGGITGTALAAGNYGAVYSGAAYGTGFGTQQSAMLAAQEAGMVSSAGGASMAAWAGYAAAFVAAWMASKSAWEKGFNNDNLTGAFKYSPESSFTDLLKLGGMSDRSANIWGGGSVYTSVFGRADPRIESQGVKGTLGGGQFSGELYADILEKGGLFRSDKRYTETAQTTDALENLMDTAAQSILVKAKEYGDALGLPADQLGSISTQIKVALGEDAEANKAEIIKVLAKYGDALVDGYASQVAPFKAYGETTAQTIERIGGAMVTANKSLSQIGVASFDKTLAGGQGAIDLTSRFGGADGLAAASNQFYQAFYSETEKTADLTKQLAEVFGDLGLTMPDVSAGADAARKAYRDLVQDQAESGKLLTTAGQDAFVTLIGVSGAFDALAKSADEAGKKTADRLKAFKGSDFFTEEQQVAGFKQQLNEGFAAINREVPKTRGEFADLVEVLAKGGKATSGLLTQVLDMADGFDFVAGAAEKSAQDLADAEKKRLDERKGLQSQLLELEGKTAELRALERAELDPLNAELYDRIKALEDEKAILAERKSLETELLTLQENTVELRNREREALDDSNVAIYNQINAIKDFNLAAEAASKAVDRALTNLRNAVENDIKLATKQRDDDLKDLSDREKAARLEHKTEIDDIKADRKDAKAQLDLDMRDFGAVNAALLKQGVAELGGYFDAKTNTLTMYNGANGQTFDDVRRLMDLEAKAREAQFKIDLKDIDTKIGSQTEIVNGLKDLSASLKQTLQVMAPEGAELQTRQEGQLQIAQALALAKTTGQLPDAATLQPALQAVTGQSTQFFSTEFEYLRDFRKTKNDVTQLSKLTDGRLTLESQQLTALEEARDLLVDGNEQAKTLMEAQLEAMKAQETLAKALYDKIDAVLQQRTEAADNKLTVDLSGIEVLREKINTDWDTEVTRLQGILTNATTAVGILTGQADALMTVGQAMDQLTAALVTLNEFDPLKGLEGFPGSIEAAIRNALSGGISVNLGGGQTTGTTPGTGTTTGTGTGGGNPYNGSTDGESGFPGGGGNGADSAGGGSGGSGTGTTWQGGTLWVDTSGATIYGTGDTPMSVMTKGGQIVSIDQLRGSLTGYLNANDYAGGSTYASQAGLSAYSIERLLGLSAGSWASFLSGVQVIAGGQTSAATLASIRSYVQMIEGEGWDAAKAAELRRWGMSQGVTGAKVDEAMGYGPGYTNQILALYNVPAFAKGGNYAGGLAMVGEEGPELINFGAPARIFSNSDSMRMLSDPGRSSEVLAAAVKELKAENAAMKKLLEKIARNTNDTTRATESMAFGGGVKTRPGK